MYKVRSDFSLGEGTLFSSKILRFLNSCDFCRQTVELI